MIPSSSFAAAPAIFLYPSPPLGIWKNHRLQLPRSVLAEPHALFKRFKAAQTVSYARRVLARTALCTASLNARCSAETQTVKSESTKVTIFPIQGLDKPPMLDDGGGAPPPPDRGGGGGGGGGGGHNSSGGFFFFSFLIFMRYLKDREEGETATKAVEDITESLPS